MAVFGLNPGPDSASDLQVFLNAFQVSFPILLDNGNIYYNQYRQSGGTSPFPLDYVIDQEGNVAYFSTEYDPEAMIAVIDQLLGGVSGHPEVPQAKALALLAAPNPFNPQTEISFFLPGSQPVSLDILDTRGHLVRTLLKSEPQPAGQNRVTWDGRDNQGKALPSGLFMARIRTRNHTAVTKLTLVR